MALYTNHLVELSNLLYGLNLREQYRMLKELVSEEKITMEQFQNYANVFPTTTRYRDYGY